MWSVWLFSVIVIFILSALWWIRIIGLWKLPDGRHWLRGKLGLVWMGRTMLSKSLIHFSVDWQGCIPSLLFDLRLNYGGGNEDNGDLLQKVPCTAALSALDPEPGHHRPTHLPETPGHSRASLGQSPEESLLLSPGSWCAQGFVRALQESISPVLSSWGSMVGLMATSSKRAYAIPRSAAPRAPALGAVHCWPITPQETPKHSKSGLA